MSDADERIGRAIIVLRAERRMQRKALSERSGIAYTFLTSIESGSRGMSHTTMTAITQVFGIMPSDLLRKAESLPPLD